MITSDVLVVGGGPAGSTCAWKLSQAGLSVAVLDAAHFPRDKVCAGWITPPVVDELCLDVDDYSRSRTFQPILGFRTGVIGRRDVVDVSFGRPVSYGIRRCEFDHYLLGRSGARLVAGEPVRDIRRKGQTWVVNRRFEAPVLVGAGGHFCPVAQRLNGAPAAGQTVAAQEAEFVVADRSAARAYATAPDRPELYFSEDLRGYGWCFRKGPVMNLGFGSLVRHALPQAVGRFVAFLQEQGRIPRDAAWHWRGHAYRLYEPAPRRVADAGLLLVGDAAGLAYPESGEGIRPAIESGLLAAAAIAAAGGDYSHGALDMYTAQLRARFGGERRRGSLTHAVPAGVVAAIGRQLLRVPWFVRRVVLERWFLHASEPALAA